ncbi:MAG: IS630 family transposase, partial [Candidatus Aquicultor sp.]
EDVKNEIGMSEDSIIKWRKRFENSGLDGLRDVKRSGRPRVYDALIRHEIAAKACTPPEGETHFSVRGLAKEFSSGGKGPSKTTVHRVLKNEIIKPHKYRMWLNQNDPLFEEKMLNIVGLYLNPPENAVVLSVDEKSSIQALERRYPNLSPGPGRVERIEHEYIRHGTQSLIAALEVHSGSVTGKCY